MGKVLDVGYLGTLESGHFQLEAVVAEALLGVLRVQSVNFPSLGAELGLQ